MLQIFDTRHRQQLRRVLATATRIVIGAVGAAAVQALLVGVFVPYSDLSAQQLAAGPKATDASGARPAPIVMAHTGRGWAADAARRRAVLEAREAARQARLDLVARAWPNTIDSIVTRVFTRRPSRFLLHRMLYSTTRRTACPNS